MNSGAVDTNIQENLNPPRFDVRSWPQVSGQAHRDGVHAARCGFRFKVGSFEEGYPGETEADRDNRIAYRAGYQAELVRIANRRMTAEQRDLLIAHDRAAGVFSTAVELFGCEASQSEGFIRADMALFQMSPWQTLGITLGQYQGPAEQAKGRLGDAARRRMAS